ncbi:MAG: MerR family transcriptional regulator [Paludibacter sp.]|nr:MerR family transcriptional regulator [Paludibacter sp.]
MEMENLIQTFEFCTCHNIEISFINSLYESGLIDIITIEEISYIPIDQVLQLEKIVHLHYELDINIEGIEAITHLLARIDSMQNNIVLLENRLGLYESNL